MLFYLLFLIQVAYHETILSARDRVILEHLLKLVLRVKVLMIGYFFVIHKEGECFLAHFSVPPSRASLAHELHLVEKQLLDFPYAHFAPTKTHCIHNHHLMWCYMGSPA
jgi:hypothetical protein